MFNWLFKKRDRTAAPTTSASAASSRATQGPAGKRAAPQPPAPAPKPVVVDLTDWPAKLRAAQGNDAALLQLATSTTVLDIKIAAVEALVGEDTLKQAEREFRSHDRKVHRIAKKRHEAAVAQRVARAAAATLIDRTAALLGDDQVAMNQLTELDRAWQALPADMLQAEQRSRYADLRTRLDTEIRERSDLQQRVQRWSTDTRLTLPELQRTVASAAEQGVAADLAPLGLALQALAETRPEAPATADLGAALAQALQDAAAVQARLAWFEAEPEPAVPRPPQRVASAAIEVDASSATPEPVATTDAAPVPTPDVASSQALTVEVAVADAATDTTAAAPAADALTTAAGTAVEAVEVAAAPFAESPELSAASPAQRWAELPAPTDTALARVLEQRFEQWQRARRPVRLPAKPVAAAAQPARADKPARPARPEPLTPEQLSRVEALVQQAEATLDDGQLSELQQQLAAVDAALGKTGLAALSDDLRARLQLLRAEGARLKGWQQWGGGRARDELTDQAEVLAKSTLAASDPEQPDAPKVDVKSQREAIHSLRMRWKELDRLGAPANQTLWQRFDAALQTASVPVAAHHAVLAAARKDNQSTREALLAALEALPLPGSAGAASYQQPAGHASDGVGDGHGDGERASPGHANLAGTGGSAVDNGSDSGHGSASDAGSDTAAATDSDAAGGSNHGRGIEWKDLARELGNFQAAWRKLGPVEHTAPADAREMLQQRYRAAIERIEAPLQAARRAAVVVREQLIAQALALVPDSGRQRQALEPGRQRPGLDAARQVRELQAQWQDHARRLPLARGVENEVWTRFKAATDAVFAQREAVFAARDAEFAANLAAAEAVLDRLGALNADTPRTEIERTLADADRAWREGGELPRGALDGIERRFRASRAAASELLAAGVRSRWQSQCDTLSSRLTLCVERETTAGEGTTPDDLAQRWSALGKLPAAWDKPLAQRWSAQVSAGPLAAPAIDDLLLQLEAVLDMPTTPAWQAERRKLKLRALKDAMEGRSAERADGAAQQADWLAALLRQGGLATQQHERLTALVAAMRQASPGALGSPVVVD
ncbi:MAG: DUF349 domain-containing protein [Burkholderiales bacterium]|nr:DUF349 domain-containing protein [Burkholderiales bacterium]